jgi:hypothetical protein
MRNGAQIDESDPEPAMPRFSSLWATPSRLIDWRQPLRPIWFVSPARSYCRFSSTIWPLS